MKRFFFHLSWVMALSAFTAIMILPPLTPPLILTPLTLITLCSGTWYLTQTKLATHFFKEKNND